MKLFKIRHHPIIAILLAADFNIVNIKKARNVYIVDMNHSSNCDIVRLRVNSTSYYIQIIEFNTYCDQVFVNRTGHCKLKDLSINFDHLRYIDLCVKLTDECTVYIPFDYINYGVYKHRVTDQLINAIGTNYTDCEVFILYKGDLIKIGELGVVRLDSSISTDHYGGRCIELQYILFDFLCEENILL